VKIPTLLISIAATATSIWLLLAFSGR